MAISKARGSGNSIADQHFIEWMKDNGGIVTIDPEEEDIPFPAKRQWQGTEDDDSPWVVPPPGDRRCVGRAFVRDEDGDYMVDAENKRIKRPCHNWAMRGTSVCIKHGGGIGRVRKGAIDRLAGSLDYASGALVRLITDEGVEDKVRLGAIKELMDRVGVRGGVEIDVSAPGYLDVLRKAFEAEGATFPEAEGAD